MNKEEAIVDFLKGLRIVLNNASAYFKEHPYFIKSVENFKQKTDQLFIFLNPVKIDITPHSLFIDGKYREKSALYVELASMFHLRKVKSIELSEGVSVEELADFLSCVSQPIREILRQGGMQNILNKGKNAHLGVEELDYSQFLKDEGEEAKDVWAYLFRKSVEKKDQLKINEFADNFEKIIAKFKASDLSQDSELRQNLYNFLNYLKDTQKEKFYSCTRSLLRSFIRDKGILKEEKLDEIRLFFKDLKIQDLTQELWSGIIEDEKFDAVNLAVFSRLIADDAHESIASGLKEEINKKEPLKISPAKRKKIKELLLSPESPFISGFYRNILTTLSQESFSSGGFSFDRELINTNYRLILLNLLIQEENRGSLDLIYRRLIKECDNAINEKDLGYLKLVLELLNKKIKDKPSLSEFFEELDKKISGFLEAQIFENEGLPDSGYPIDLLKKSSLGADFYLDKIFNQGKVSREVLGLWFKFFPEGIKLFYDNLKRKNYDLELMGRIISGLSGIDSSLSLEALKEIFNSSNNIVKLEVLKALQNFAYRDDGFLYSVLQNKGALLKKEALLILAKDDLSRDVALKKIFSFSGPWWGKNKVIIENIMLVDAIGLKEARRYLESCAKKKFFWNKRIREKAQGVLKKWHD